MLFYQAINAKALELLKQLLSLKFAADLRLVGGTALALQIGHRKSVDIDLFGKLTEDEISITKELEKTGQLITLSKTTNIKVFSINGIKVDLVNYPYAWLVNAKFQDDLRLADLPDIAAMKLAAITGRGTRKDFTDIYFLLQHFSMKEMLQLYNRKYHDGSEFMVLKSLTYFNDAETDEELKMLKSVSWSYIKDLIREKVEQYVHSL
jgi:hypothetical protein